MSHYIPDFKDYAEVIKKLPLQKKYTKEELLIPELLVREKDSIAIYYAAHNEYFNPKAKVFIIGITPGFAQMEKSIVAARWALEENLSKDEIIYHCKKEARFAGTLRKNIIRMLDELKLTEMLNLNSCASLFEEEDKLLHTTSMLPFATFIKGKNYTGHTPVLVKNEFLMADVRAHFYPQIEALENALIIPLGRCVEEVLRLLIREGKLHEERCLLGFPHPSGANVNGRKQFEEEKTQMMIKIKEFGIKYNC